MGTFVEPAAAQGAAAVIQALQEVDEEYNSKCIPMNSNSSSDSILSNGSVSESLRQTEELAWIRHRLARKRQDTRESEALRLQQQHNRSDDNRSLESKIQDQVLNEDVREMRLFDPLQQTLLSHGCTSLVLSDPQIDTTFHDPVAALGTLQLRRLLRAVGLLSEDLAKERLQETLVGKVREAIAAGRFAAYLEEQRVAPKDSFQCVVQMRKTASIVVLMENILAASSARPTCTSVATPSPPPSLMESTPIPPGKSWCNTNSSSTASTEEESPPSSPSLCLEKASSSGSPHTPETLPATPFHETPSTTGSDSTVAKRVLQTSPPLLQDSSKESLATSSFRDDAAGGMRDGRARDRSVLQERAEAPGSASRGGGGLFSSRGKGAVPPGKKDGGSPRGKWGFASGRKEGVFPGGNERQKTRVVSSRWCRVVGRGWVLQEKAVDTGVAAAEAQATDAVATAVPNTTSGAYDSRTASTTTVTRTQGVPSPAALVESSSPSSDSASTTTVTRTQGVPSPAALAESSSSSLGSASNNTETPNLDDNSSPKKAPVESLSEGDIEESSSRKPVVVEKGSPTGAKSSTKSSSNCKSSSTNKARWGPPNAAPLLRKKMATMASEKLKKSPQGGGGYCVSSNRNKGLQQDKSRLGNVRTVTRSIHGKPIRGGKAATSEFKTGVSSKSSIPPPVPPRPGAPPVPPRPGSKRNVSPPSNQPGQRAGGKTPVVTWNSNIGSTSSNRRPLLAAGGLLKSGSSRPIVCAGGVGVKRNGVIRPVTPSRLPTAMDYDDDSGSDNTEGTSIITNNSRGEPTRSKVLMPSATAMMNNNNQHAAVQQQKQMALPKPFKAKNIEVIFDDPQDEEGSGKGYDSDRDDSDSEEEENDPEMKMLEPEVIPEWAKPEALKVALEQQYGGEKPINPSTIFIDFYTCNLESIFDTKKKKWERKSTGDWMTDRLTMAEKLAYDRAMGYVTINSHSTKGTKDRTA